jgi:serine/threonine-protein kinase RsbT
MQVRSSEEPSGVSIVGDEELEQKLLRVLGMHVGEIMARSVMIHCTKMSNVVLSKMRSGDAERLLLQLDKGLRLYVDSVDGRKTCVEQIASLLKTRNLTSAQERQHLVSIQAEIDIVTARNVGRDICRDLGFSVTGQTRVATAISELARNIVQYTPGGTMSLASVDVPRPGISIIAKDTGGGIPHLEDILAGSYVSPTGMGKGLAGTRQLMDSFVVVTGPTGTEITARKYLAAGEVRRR